MGDSARGNALRASVTALAVAALVALSIAPRASADGPPAIQWVREFGGTGWDMGSAIALDPTGIYVGGSSDPSSAFLRKYTFDGELLWAEILPHVGITATTAGEGSVYIAGYTWDFPKAGFVRKYDADGHAMWTQQIRLLGSDYAYGVSVHAATVYVAGYTIFGGPAPGEEGFVRAYDLDGNELWTTLIAAPRYVAAHAVTTDDSGVYVTGEILDMNGTDALFAKLSFDGTILWIQRVAGEDADLGVDIAVVGTGLYVAGFTESSLTGEGNGGGSDAFLVRYDTDGTEVWRRQFGSPEWDAAYAVAGDGGGVYVAGWAEAALPNQTSSGDADAFVRKYDFEGREAWTLEFGTGTLDDLSGLAVNGNVYGVGSTYGSYPEQTNAGQWDAFVVRIGGEPSWPSAGLSQSSKPVDPNPPGPIPVPPTHVLGVVPSVGSSVRMPGETRVLHMVLRHGTGVQLASMSMPRAGFDEGRTS